jgi:hypothetical protein
VYSPEWQAFLAARAAGAEVKFIDLPYADIAGDDDQTNLYADADLRRGQYVRQLCAKLGVEGFDQLWDSIFEVPGDLSTHAYLRSAHHLCGHIRLLEGEGREPDRRREAFMAGHIRLALEQYPEPERRILVVTGGYHSIALHARLTGAPLPGGEAPAEWQPAPPEPREERGIALTPYSYERLDSLRGYNAGMPNPGFYDRVWQDRLAGRTETHRGLLFQVAKALRERKQRVSSADLIAAEACAAGLAHLRGREHVWRTDLVDGAAGALIKDELAVGGSHPLLDAIHEALRGNARGALAAGTALPPLVQDMRLQCQALGLTATPAARDVELELTTDADRKRSRVLHRLRILGIAGYARTAGTDFTRRDDLSRVFEKWQVRWSPDLDSTSIEAARYGPTLSEAAAARLAENADALERSAEKAAILLLDASLADLNALAGRLHQQAGDIIRQDGEFLSLTAALGHLLYLYRFDDTLGTSGRPDVGLLLSEAFGRGVWLLETLGQISDRAADAVEGVQRLLQTAERCDESLGLDRAEFVEVLKRVEGDTGQVSSVRGAAVGALWVLGEADAARVRADLKLFADPERLGDFLTGLFALAREVVQRHQDLILAIDEMLIGYVDEDFLAALPSLRLAFTYFTPREKHHMATNLLESLGIKETKPLAALEVSPEQAARALAAEARIFAAVKLYGLRGGTP